MYSEKRRATTRAWQEAHPQNLRANALAYYYRHHEQRKAYMRKFDQALKAEALRALGSKCACPGCEVSEPRFLTIDHIYGRSKTSRKDAVEEARASRWDKTKFQILCWNCNMSKRDSGFCPVHQTDPGQRNRHSPDLGNPQLLLWPP